MDKKARTARTAQGTRAMEPHVSPKHNPITIDMIGKIADHAARMLSSVREHMLAPHPRKKSPTFSTAAVAQLCHIDKKRLVYLANKGEIPAGESQGNGRARTFSLAETRQIVSYFGSYKKKPTGQPGKVITIGNFKGGVSKTSTVMTLAQALSLRGRRVLMIDIDPQASLTTLCGILADTEVDEDETVLPLIYHHGDMLAAQEQLITQFNSDSANATLSSNDRDKKLKKTLEEFESSFDLEHRDLRYAIQDTYWDGIDLIPAMSALFAAEFVIPTTQIKDSSFQFWNIINKGLEPLREIYDVILIDTPPALSYMTINAFLAADGLIVPTPPNALDYASSTQFWSLFNELRESMALSHKQFDFIYVLLAKVDRQQAATPIVSDWIRSTYEGIVLPIEIPQTTVTQTAAAEFGTVYDIERYDGSAKTYSRARTAYDDFADYIDQQLCLSWYARSADA